MQLAGLAALKEPTIDFFVCDKFSKFYNLPKERYKFSITSLYPFPMGIDTPLISIISAV